MHKHRENLDRRPIKKKESLIILCDIQQGFYKELIKI